MLHHQAQLEFDVGMILRIKILYFAHNGSAIEFSIVKGAYKCLAKQFIWGKGGSFIEVVGMYISIESV
jgi:hypothetical protein